MRSFLESITDDTVLAAKLAVVLNSDLPDFLQTTYSERARVYAKRMFVIVSVVFLASIVVSFSVLKINFDTWPERIFGGIAMCWVAVFLISGRSWFMSKRILSREMNMALTPIITNTLDTMALYTHTEDTPDEIQGKVQELLLQSSAVVVSKDRYQVFADNPVQYDEVHINRVASQLVTEAGGAELARGVLITTSIPQPAGDFVAVSAAHDHLLDDVWAEVSVGKYVVPVSTQTQVRVCVDHEAAATAVATPDVEAVFTFLAQQHQTGYVCVIQGNELQLLLLGDSIRIPVGSSTTDRTVIARQAFTILQPIWKGLRVAEGFARVV